MTIPLDVFIPNQRLSWPLRLDSEPWLAFNAAGTAHHWTDATLTTPREDGAFPLRGTTPLNFDLIVR